MGVIVDGGVPRFSPEGDRYFFHVVSGRESPYEQRYRHRINYPDLSVAERTTSIATKGRIEGRPKGIFIKFLPDTSHHYLTSVSLAWTDVALLKRHFGRRCSETAFCFDHGYLWAEGLRPVRHVRRVQDIDFTDEGWETAYLYDVANTTYDFRWEMEWRVRDSLEFGAHSLSFVLTEDSAFGSASLELKSSPIHRFLDSCLPFVVPENMREIMSASFEIPFVCSSLISDPSRFLARFVEENCERIEPLCFGLGISRLAAHFDDIADIHALVSDAIRNADEVFADEADFIGFQQTFLEYIYVSRMMENPLAKLVEQMNIDSEWDHTQLDDYRRGLADELCRWTASRLAEHAYHLYWGELSD